ncbi:TRAP transporter substrate-binding protein DctP [Pollutimonas bauzanensis]|uniref:TRAP-type C4-dicarboxylate transport system, substrate-binding protein n=1 Tax=Pollutimonas bauzanensis TaxID=658167 RepID=A0A1M5Q4L8_9BURK|nr:TRAP transporter substrate-binding protein DctP [Pollutimonas bauzanensis]SHH08689.1 TRAP-type C4-dicarboxylate transport system, substrate-binding protein [Pollutimonas bauzanensis]
MTISPRLLSLGAAAAALTFSAAVAAADFNWKFYTYFAPNDKPTLLHKAFAEDVSKASNDRLRIQVYASGELPYKASDVLRSVARNQVQIGDVAFGFVAGDVPQLNALSMPFSCTSIDKFYDNAAPNMEKDINEVLGGKFKTQSIMQWVMPPQQLWLTNPVSGIDGLKNLKVRAWNREQVDMMAALGGAGVTVTPAEVIPSLQRGVVNGAFTAAVPALDWKFYEVTKMGYMLNLTLAHQAMVVNQKAMHELPGDLQKLLLDKAQEWAPKYRAAMIEADREARKQLQEKGMTLMDVSPADMEKLRAATQPIGEAWAAKNGPMASKMLAGAIDACK